MIHSIVNLFREQAREHKTIRSFCYNRRYELGNGNETHPMLWLEDPIYGQNRGNQFINSVNFSILFIPRSNEEVLHFQNLAFSIGLNILERIKADRTADVSLLPTWSFVTLRDYYDNNACGCRFSAELSQLNMQNLCLIEEQFDAAGSLLQNENFADFDLNGSDAGGHTPAGDKLPVFDLKIRKA